MFNLLAASEKSLAITIACAVGAVLFLYGFFKRFSRMSWWGWQVAVLFTVTLLLGKIPAMDNETAYFAVVLGGFFAVTAVVLGIGAILKSVFRSRRKKAHWFIRAFDCLIGAVTAVLNFALFVLILGGVVLLILYYCTGVRAGFLETVFAHEIWTDYGAKYLLDLLLVWMLVTAVKGGYKLGLLKSVWTVVMVALTLAAFAGGIAAALKVPFVASLAQNIAASFPNLNATLANVIGYGIMSLVCFVVFMIVVILLNLLINLGVRELDRVKAFRFLDGAIMAIVIFSVVLALVSGVNYAVYAADSGAFGEAVQNFFSENGVTGLFRSSPFADFVYEYNPLRLLIGGAQ